METLSSWLHSEVFALTMQQLWTSRHSRGLPVVHDSRISSDYKPRSVSGVEITSDGRSLTNDTTWLEIEGCYSRVYTLSLAYIHGLTLSVKDREKKPWTVDIVQTYVLL